ncbi:MAG: methionine adenosyltransferase domain-containing protein [Candidatus Nomurabacteria bacterium]|nr:methionine adenosyltransferase domain-containing protein [Candidatus Nomurabacteria bacterium]MCX6788462.1 methionine adenosyltransferase domain-containing protein [Candidatus Jorgensenbacteria bacterium]
MRTAECTTPNHPDKLCDRISDAILDACLEQDPTSRVAIETMGGHGVITITGELTTKAQISVREIARKIAGHKYGVQSNIVMQSPEISQGVDNGGAGDQGIMVGYACRDNEDMIPQELYLARSLAQFLYERFPYDGKTQITLGEHGVITTVVASFQNTNREELEDAVMQWGIIKRVIPKNRIWKILANPAGDWNIGGFEADTGLTGRKLIVDNYGPLVPIGGGAFSGKDATKVDRSAAYMARKIAVDYLKKNKGDFVFVQLAYAIGMTEPVQATIVADGHAEQNIVGYDLTPKGIIEFLDLQKPQFEKTAEWGHFGNGFKWDN